MVPPAYVVEVNETVLDYVRFFENVTVTSVINETVVKQGCKIAVKNIFDSPLKISLHYIPSHPELQEFIDVSCKFEHTTKSTVELMPDESVQVRVRVVPKPNTHMTKVFMSRIEMMSREDLPLEKSTSFGVQSLFDHEQNIIQDGFVNWLMKLRSGMFKFGTIQFHPTMETLKRETPSDLSNIKEYVDVNSRIPSPMDVSFSRRPIEQQLNPAQIGDSILLTDSDGVSVDLLGGFKLGPTTHVLPWNNDDHTQLTASITTIPSTDVIGGVVIDFQCDDVRVEGKCESEVDFISTMQLVRSEQYFYVSNPTNSTIHFEIISSSYRCPGIKLQFAEKWYTDTVQILVTPNEGDIPVGTAIRLCAQMTPGNAREANILFNKLSGKDMHSHSSPKLQGAISNDSSPRQLLLCLPIEIWDTNCPLHPPSIVFGHLQSSTFIQPFRSHPISELRNLKVSSDLQLLKSLLDTENESFNSISSCRSVFNLSELPRNYRTTEAVEKSPIGTNCENIEPPPTSLQLYETNKSLSLKPQTTHRMLQLRGVTQKADQKISYIELGRQVQKQEHIEWFVTIENHKAVLTRFSVDFFSSAALTTPLSKSDNSYCLVNGHKKWLQLGQNGGVIEANAVTSIVVYFNRSFVGYFCGIIVLCDLDSMEYHVIRVTMRIVSDDGRKNSVISRASCGKLSTPSLFSMSRFIDFVTFAWIVDHLQMKFRLCESTAFACIPSSTVFLDELTTASSGKRAFVLKAMNHQTYKLQYLDIGSVKLKNTTMLTLDFLFSVSVKHILATVIRTTLDNPQKFNESKIPTGSNFSLSIASGEEIEFKLSMNPSSYKSAMVRSGIEYEQVPIADGNCEQDFQYVEARVVGSLCCTCLSFDSLTTTIPIHELVK
jgi:hypothetical protein